MESLGNKYENTPLPAGVSVIEVHNQIISPSDTISQLYQASVGGLASLSSPIGAKDIGLPKSPQRRVIEPGTLCQKNLTDTKDTISLEEYGIGEPYLASTRSTFYVLLHDVIRNKIQLLIFFHPQKGLQGTYMSLEPIRG